MDERPSFGLEDEAEVLPEPPAPGRWLPERPRPERPAWMVPAFVVGLIGALAARVALGQWLGLLLGFPFALLMVPLILSWGLLDTPRFTDLRLLEDPNDPDVCLVRLTLMAEGREVGEDRGVCWFEDGRLLYSGHRTSFAVGGEDVAPRSHWDTFRAEGRELPDTAVPLRGEERRLIVVKPLSRKSDIGLRQEVRFLKALYAFKREPPRSSGPRQWPPFEV